MSSEQWYDYSYEQFVQDHLPNLGLFGNSTTTLIADASANPQQHGESFPNDADTVNDFELGAYEGAGQLVSDAEDLRNEEDESQTFDHTAGHPQADRSEIVQPPLWGNHVPPTGLAMPSDDVAQRTHLGAPRTGPINCYTSRPATAIQVEWSGPQKCHWRDCTSKATFRSPSSLKAHIKNIHVAPLLCTHPNCSYKKPFGKPCDLKRHMAAIHNMERGYSCLESDCQEVFSRRDKMMIHAKEKHELFKCCHNHCSANVFATQRESHLRDSHGLYECAIGSCESGCRSFFTKVNLKRHVRTLHGITSDPMWTVMQKLTTNDEGGSWYAYSPFAPNIPGLYILLAQEE